MSNEDIEKSEDMQETVAETESAEQAEAGQDTEKLLEDARNKADEYWNELLRARADLENLRRRHARDLENAHKHALDKFVAELLPICDSLELGIDASKKDEATLATVRDGMDMTLKMLIGNIGKLGLEQINPEGEAFNPELHQAVSMQPADGIDANQVISVMQKGYTFNGRVIRPAMVVVSQ
jgi:molecular chaperone GrpE